MARDLAIHPYKTQTRANIACARTSPGYTGAIGKDFEWLDATAAPATLRPTLPIRDLAEGLVLKWNKKIRTA